METKEVVRVELSRVRAQIAVKDEKIKQIETKLEEAFATKAESGAAYLSNKETELRRERKELVDREDILVDRLTQNAGTSHALPRYKRRRRRSVTSSDESESESESSESESEDERKRSKKKRVSRHESSDDEAPISTARVENILTGFWRRVLDGLDSMPPAEKFKAKYPLTRSAICQLPRPGRYQPSLLWQGLNQPFENSKTILQTVRAAAPNLVMVCDVSGAGKTRTLYEIAVEQPCLYLTGVPDDGPVTDGSRDLLVVRDALARIYETGEIPVASLTTCFKVLVLVRSFMYKSSGVDNNLTFLFKQVMHRHLNYPEMDPWAYLTTSILDLARSKQALKELNIAVSELLRRYPWDGPVILDECQELKRYLTDRFVLKKCMLDKAIISLQDAGINNTIYLSGTGRSLFHMANHLSAGTWKHRVTVYWFTNLGGFANAQALETFASTILDNCAALDFDRLELLYRGRYRAFVTAIEYYIMENPDTSVATQRLLDFGVAMATRRGAAASEHSSDDTLLSNVNRTVLDDVYKFFGGLPSAEVEAAKALVEAVVMNMFFGSGKMVALNPTLSLVEYGLARVTYRGSSEGNRVTWIQNGREGSVGHGKDGDETRLVEISEPLVVIALWQYYKEQACVKSMRHQHFLNAAQLDASSRGKAYEAQVAEMIGRQLHGKCLAKLFSTWNREVPPIYNRTARLVKPAIDLGRPFGVETEEFRLLDWIDSVVEQKDGFYTFFSTSSNSSCGPDMWFFLALTDEGEKDRKDEEMLTDGDDKGGEKELIICAVQMKTLKRMSRAEFRAAQDSLDFNRLFLHKKNGQKKKIKRAKDAEAAKVVQEFPHHLKLVVTTDCIDLMVFKPTDAPVHRVKRQRTQHAGEAKRGLLGVLDGSNIHLFVDSWLVNAVRDEQFA